jgi:hypothetical protein
MVGRRVKRVLRGGGFALALLQASCGIFSPRSSETPEVPARIDPLNFSAIMDGTGHAFTKLLYDDLFMEAFGYDDLHSGSHPKSVFVPYLQQIQTQYPNIQVQWKRGQIYRSADNDTMVLSGLEYYIFPDGNTSGPPADSGSSNFTVVNDQDWLIYQWTDVPSGAGRSFFAPP